MTNWISHVTEVLPLFIAREMANLAEANCIIKSHWGPKNFCPKMAIVKTNQLTDALD